MIIHYYLLDKAEDHAFVLVRLKPSIYIRKERQFGNYKPVYRLPVTLRKMLDPHVNKHSKTNCKRNLL